MNPTRRPRDCVHAYMYGGLLVCPECGITARELALERYNRPSMTHERKIAAQAIICLVQIGLTTAVHLGLPEAWLAKAVTMFFTGMAFADLLRAHRDWIQAAAKTNESTTP